MMGDYLLYIRAFAALAFVLALVAVVAWMLRRFGGAPSRGPTRGRRRLGIVDTAQIDPKRRLVLVRRDDTEHLLLVGGTQDLVIETGISTINSLTLEPSATAPQPDPRGGRFGLDEVRF